MEKNIEPKLRKIGEYLKLENDTVFTIPEYQRAYAWNIDNCDKLWQDIIDYINSGNKDRYFFGTIIINCQDKDTKYSLIDGQQRTTTLLLLLKALLIKINAEIGKTTADQDSVELCRGLKDRRRKIMGILYRAEPEDIEDLPDAAKDAALCQQVAILENFSINEQYKNELNVILQAVDFETAQKQVVKIPNKQKDNRYTNFFRNFKFFYEQKISLLSGSELNNFAKTLLGNCEVIEIKSWQIEQAITMFNSLNSDGMPLCDADIIAAKLYAAAEKLNQSAEFTKLWESLLEEIDELQLRGIVDIDAILMQYMYYERGKNQEHEIVKSTGAINVTVPGVRRFFIQDRPDLINRKPIDTCKEMLKVAKIWKKVADYSVMKVLLKFNENVKLFLGGYFYRCQDENNINEVEIKLLTETMLRLFAILELVDAGYSSAKFKTFLFGELTKLVNPKIPVSEIVSDFNRHINDKWAAEDLKTSIVTNEKNSLVYLNEYLFAKGKGVELKFSSKCDIEHIMPASGNNLPVIRKDAGIASEQEFRAVVNQIGNKILLEENINRSIGNEWFRTKISTTLENKTGYLNSVYPLACDLVAIYQNVKKPLWKKTDIKAATDKASERIAKFIFNN